MVGIALLRTMQLRNHYKVMKCSNRLCNSFGFTFDKDETCVATWKVMALTSSDANSIQLNAILDSK